MAIVGIYGKLPAHGDFVQRNLPGSFIEPWDEWLQGAVHGSRELVGAQWLDYFLTSPVWRFAFSAGVIDAHAWAGVLVPSVDSVGRYFPMTIAAAIPPKGNPFSCMRNESGWYQTLSDLAIEALQNALQVDDLIERFPSYPSGSAHISCAQDRGGLVRLTGAQAPGDDYPQLLEKLVSDVAASFSLWWCAGSQHMTATSMLCHGLPDVSVYRSMLGAPELHW